MKKVSILFDWALIATALVAFAIGRFIAPAYERYLQEWAHAETVYPVSEWALMVSGFFGVCVLTIWILRIVDYR